MNDLTFNNASEITDGPTFRRVILALNKSKTIKVIPAHHVRDENVVGGLRFCAFIGDSQMAWLKAFGFEIMPTTSPTRFWIAIPR